MSMSASQYLERYATLADDLPGRNLPWLTAVRRAALAQFSAGGFPSPREEEWKYTNVAPIEKKLFEPSTDVSEETDLSEEFLAECYLADAWVLILVDGHFRADYSRLEGLPEGLAIRGLSEALQNDPERVERLLGQTLPQKTHGFIAFNTAFFTDGAFIDIPKGVELKRPLQILHWSSRPDGLATTRNLIALGEHARAQVVESYFGNATTGYLTASLTEVALAEHACLVASKMQTESNKAYHFGGFYLAQARGSRLVHHNLAFGGLLARSEIHITLRSGAECELNGLFLGQGRQHVDNHTVIRHTEPHGTSRETYRGVLDGRARGVFQGRILVQPDAQKTSAEMNNRNLLLSEDAEIDTKPQLEILADDVKCSHGVTVGQLSPEAVFYLESRGVDRASARNMLTFAFANEMVEKIGLDSVRADAQTRLLRAFPQAGIRKDWL